MMLADIHVAVREALRGSPYSKFLVTVQTAELHPGRVEVEWRVCVTHGEPVEVVFFRRGRNPYAILADLRSILTARPALAKTEPEHVPEPLAAVGAPPHAEESAR